MKRKLLVGLILIVVSCITSMSLVGCVETAEPPYYVRLHIANEELGSFQGESALRLKSNYDGKPKVFDIKVYNLGLERYIVDDDMEIKNLNYYISVAIKTETDPHHKGIDFEDATTWPTEVGFYDIVIKFNITPLDFDERDYDYRTDTIRIDLTIEEE